MEKTEMKDSLSDSIVTKLSPSPSRILYCGLNPDTLETLLLEKTIHIVGVAWISELGNYRSFNPANLLFNLAYNWRREVRARWVERIFISLWSILWPLAALPYQRHRNILRALSLNNISLVDFDRIDDTIKFISKVGAELIVVDCWSKIPVELIEAPKYGCLGIHPSALPLYRGALPTLWALKDIVSESAVSFFMLNERWDEGRILEQIPFPIQKNDDWFTVEETIRRVVKQTLTNTIRKYLCGQMEPKAQHGMASPTAQYEAYRQIRWQEETVREIVNKVGLYPWIDPFTYCYFLHKNRKCVIKRIVECKHIPHCKPKDKDIWLSGSYIYCNAKDGYLILRLFIDIDVMTSIWLFTRRLELK
jgi:methionyl-tRNA formyltransferase